MSGQGDAFTHAEEERKRVLFCAGQRSERRGEERQEKRR